MESGGSYLFIIVIGIIALVIFLTSYFSKKAIIKRKLKKSEHLRIADFSSGEVAKITGRVEPVDEPLKAPLSGRMCAYYYVHVEQKVSSGKSSRWKTIIEEEKGSKFLINDGSSLAFINDKRIKSYIVQDRNFSSGFMRNASENLEAYLKSKGKSSENFLGMNKTLRYNEGVLEEGEEIAVWGYGKREEAAFLDLPAHLGEILTISSAEGEPVHLSDSPDTL